MKHIKKFKIWILMILILINMLFLVGNLMAEVTIGPIYVYTWGDYVTETFDGEPVEVFYCPLPTSPKRKCAAPL